MECKVGRKVDWRGKAAEVERERESKGVTSCGWRWRGCEESASERAREDGKERRGRDGKGGGERAKKEGKGRSGNRRRWCYCERG